MLLFIHRKDLRTTDLAAFDELAKQERPSLHVLILDPFLLRRDRHREHSGSNFLQHVRRLRELYAEAGQQLHLFYGEPEAVVGRLLETHPIEGVFFHEDYTPYALQRDRTILEAAENRGVDVYAYSDLPLADLRDFQHWTGRSEPYKVYTPFYRRWREYLAERHQPVRSAGLTALRTQPLAPEAAGAFPLPPELAALLAPGGLPALPAPEEALADFLDERLPGYAEGRDRFARDDTSGLSRHLNAGALSVRFVYERLMDEGSAGVEAWLRQLAWRDFYLYQARLDPDFFTYEKRYDFSELDAAHFRAWAEGRTGIPIIDAAMTQLNETGWMPNRLRMITAMFLTKNLLCPFTFGERYFRLKLADYDNALNRGGWLWCASLGFDATPYFRVMNPVTQSETHDPAGAYIRRWLPALASLSDKEIHRPRPGALVDLKASRARAIDVYKKLLQTAPPGRDKA